MQMRRFGIAPSLLAVLLTGVAALQTRIHESGLFISPSLSNWIAAKQRIGTRRDDGRRCCRF